MRIEVEQRGRKVIGDSDGNSREGRSSQLCGCEKESSTQRDSGIDASPSRQTWADGRYSRGLTQTYIGDQAVKQSHPADAHNVANGAIERGRPACKAVGGRQYAAVGQQGACGA